MEYAVSLDTMLWIEAESAEEARRQVAQEILDLDGEPVFGADEFSVLDVREE